MESVEQKIEQKIKAKPRGSLFFPDSFSHLGSSTAVRKALQRITEKGFIKKVAFGIYARPMYNSYIGEVMPGAEEVALAIAKRDKIRIVPTGAWALNALGLSTQVPMKIVYLTDGAARTIKVGKRTIKFKKTTPKNLMAKGQISSLVIQALKEIGKDNTTDEEIQKILLLLKEENKSDLKHDIGLAPEWIREIMKAT